jgi:hypothetical protein
MRLALTEEAAKGNTGAFLALDALQLAIADRYADAVGHSDTGVSGAGAGFQAAFQQAGKQVCRGNSKSSHPR